MKKNILLRGIMVGALAVATAGFAGCHANIGPPSLDWEVQMGGHGEEGHEAEGHETEGHEEELLEEVLHEELLEDEILDLEETEDLEETDILDEEDIEEATASSTSGNAVTIDHVNFRTKASRDADIMETITTGIEVEVLSTEGEWAHISYNGKTGYVSVEYLDIEDF